MRKPVDDQALLDAIAFAIAAAKRSPGAAEFPSNGGDSSTKKGIRT
jgi:hypothetical protein